MIFPFIANVRLSPRGWFIVRARTSLPFNQIELSTFMSAIANCNQWRAATIHHFIATRPFALGAWTNRRPVRPTDAYRAVHQDDGAGWYLNQCSPLQSSDRTHTHKSFCWRRARSEQTHASETEVQSGKEINLTECAACVGVGLVTERTELPTRR